MLQPIINTILPSELRFVQDTQNLIGTGLFISNKDSPFNIFFHVQLESDFVILAKLQSSIKCQHTCYESPARLKYEVRSSVLCQYRFSLHDESIVDLLAYHLTEYKSRDLANMACNEHYCTTIWISNGEGDPILQSISILSY